MNIGKREEKGVVILEPVGRIDSNTASVLELAIDSIGSGVNDYHLLLDLSSVWSISPVPVFVLFSKWKKSDKQPQNLLP